MIFNIHYKLKKNLLFKQFKNNIQIKKYIYLKKQINIILKSKNSNNFIYNIIKYKYKNLKILYIIINKYNLILIKFINFWYILNNYYIKYDKFYLIKTIFTYF
ncbi:hypothetical chloroplast reading frame 93, putative [Plasmodium berghei ANKA]|uniref:Open reading frame 105 n=2 Tax=Plasmodium berghei TaxID=5821 RepID=H7CDP8_PLABE|nr:open reading frame 105 [Plasmodium berghei]VUC58745.1 hypothetical chloroplast reading frame 93, putative [Plasmodium berghei ANKA]